MSPAPARGTPRPEPRARSPEPGTGERASTARRPARQREGPSGRSDSLWGYEADLERLDERLCRHHQDADDVAHGALVKAVTHLEGLRSEATLCTWLHRIAVNECAVLRRRPPPLSIEELGPRQRV